MALMEKPPQPESAEKRVSEKIRSNDDYREYDSLLVLDILQSEAKFKFGKCIEELEFGEKADLTAPETITRERRNQRNHDKISDKTSWGETKIENKVLVKVQEKKHYANSDTVLTLDLWIDEAEERWGKTLSELSWEQKKKLTKPESISGARRKLTREGFLSPDGEVQEPRIRKADRFQEYFSEV